MLENFTETIRPSNRRKYICNDKIEDIVLGSTSTHVFDLAFNYTEYVQESKVIYKQGLHTVLEKDPINNPDTFLIDENDNRTIITIILTPEETLQFKPNYLTTTVQLKILNKKPVSSEWSGEVLYNRPAKLRVEAPADYEYPDEEDTK